MPPSAPPPGLLRRLDGRIKLLLLIVACFTCQYLPDLLLPVWLILLALLLRNRDMRGDTVRVMLRGSVAFILFWLIMTAGSDILLGKSAYDALLPALPLGGRLLALTLVGVAFSGLSSPLETGRAAAWFMRPALGKRVWKPALAIALTAWFLPLTLRVAADVRAGMRARGLALPLKRRALLMVGTGLRILERKAADLALGISSRRLDDWRSW